MRDLIEREAGRNSPRVGNYGDNKKSKRLVTKKAVVKKEGQFKTGTVVSIISEHKTCDFCQHKKEQHYVDHKNLDKAGQFYLNLLYFFNINYYTQI